MENKFHPAYRCGKCGQEQEVPYTLNLLGAGRVCYSCFQAGNKNDDQMKRFKERMKAKMQRTARLGIEGKGLGRFA